MVRRHACILAIAIFIISLERASSNVIKTSLRNEKRTAALSLLQVLLRSAQNFESKMHVKDARAHLEESRENRAVIDNSALISLRDKLSIQHTDRRSAAPCYFKICGIQRLAGDQAAWRRVPRYQYT